MKLKFLFFISTICFFTSSVHSMDGRPPEDKFDIVCKKFHALVEAQIHDNKSLLEQRYGPLSGVLSEHSKNSADQIESRKLIEADIQYFESLRSKTWKKFSPELDKFLWELHKEKVHAEEARDALAHAKKKLGNGKKAPSKKTAWESTCKGDLSFTKWALRKLSPFQFGAFDFILQSTTIGPHELGEENFRINIQEMPSIFVQKLKHFTTSELPKASSTLSSEAVQYVANQINKMANTPFQGTISAKSSNAEIIRYAFDLATHYARIDHLRRHFTSPATIQWLHKTYPSKPVVTMTIEEVITCIEPPKLGETVSPEPVRPLIVEQPKDHIIVEAPKTTEVLVKREKKPSKLEARAQQKRERAEAQRRAKIWSENLYATNLAGADLTALHDLESDFKWMNQLIDHKVRLTYQDIVGKLGSLCKIVNDEGSRRHFIIYDTPVGRPIACYFHEPHPDKPVAIEAWRLSMVERLREAGYYRAK